MKNLLLSAVLACIALVALPASASADLDVAANTVSLESEYVATPAAAAATSLGHAVEGLDMRITAFDERLRDFTQLAAVSSDQADTDRPVVKRAADNPASAANSLAVSGVAASVVTAPG